MDLGNKFGKGCIITLTTLDFPYHLYSAIKTQ
jgi:hypothetical protein